MIMVAIIALAGVVLTLAVNALANMPVIPDNGWLTILSTMIAYVRSGVKFLNAFMYPNIVIPLVTFCVACKAIFEGYRLVMWVMKKIPMFGVSD